VRLTPEAKRALREHSWPGNVRELDHVIARAFLLLDGDELTDLGIAGGSAPAPAAGEWPAIPLAEAEARTLAAALRRTDGDKTKAAKLLGISRTALYEKLKRAGAS
jgi:DNA-binding NtrC family response regulator